MKDSTTTVSSRKMHSDGDSQRTPPTLLGLPSEIKTEVFRNLPVSSLVALQTTHSQLASPARAILYEAPYFASTFRLAQFTQTITQNSLYGPLVHKIDFSELPDVGKYSRAEELLQELQRKRQREKAKKAAAEAQRRLKEEESEQKPRSNPCLSPVPKVPNEEHFYYNLLHQAIKIPIGFLFHILTECANIQVLNLNHVVFDTDYQTQDYLRDCNFSQHEWDYLLTFHPTTRAVREDREEAENKAILEQDLVALIVRLKGLKSLAVNGCNWMADKQKVKLCEGGVVFEKDDNVAPSQPWIPEW